MLRKGCKYHSLQMWGWILFVGGLLGIQGSVWGFSLEDVATQAKTLAQESYIPPESTLPAAFREMKFADYQQIRFKPEQAYWHQEGTPFELQFYHQGMHFDTAVKINEITATQVREIKYSPEYFDFGDLEVDPAAMQGLGFAGFRVHFPLNHEGVADELISLVGASYFRALGRNQGYGLSARGLAIDTALPSGEEFPHFREFWVEYPRPDRRNLLIYALLDSPRATGAYRLKVTPGDDTTVEVSARLYLRQTVGKLGIAPLSSMFLFGSHQPSQSSNFRPGIHDSSGLLIQNGNGEMIWRPLNNPKRLAMSSFTLKSPKGYGLLQRSHDFRDYQDLDNRYDCKPSGWVEILGDWGEGAVELVEIPTPNETNDNIIAFWSPKVLPEPGEAMALNYRLHFTRNESALYPANLAWTAQTHFSLGDIRQSNPLRQSDGSLTYLVDFQGGILDELAPDADLQPQIHLDDDIELIESGLRFNPVTKGWRLMMHLIAEDTARPLEMRAWLQYEDHPVTETWTYRLPSAN